MEEYEKELLLFSEVPPEDRPLTFQFWIVENTGYLSFEDFYEDMKKTRKTEDEIYEIIDEYYEEYEDYCNNLGFIIGSTLW